MQAWKESVWIRNVDGMRNSPNHELVVTAARIVVGVRSSEDIVRDISTNVPGLVVPLDVRGHARDAAHSDALVELPASICIALYIVLAALPIPLGRPTDARP